MDNYYNKPVYYGQLPLYVYDKWLQKPVHNRHFQKPVYKGQTQQSDL